MSTSPAHTATRPAPLEGSARLWGTIALSLATFMNVLDSSIANVSIPAISGDLGVSPTQGTWVITSFAVSNAISVPLTGWLTMRFGQVRLFVSSVLLFVIASWCCGLSPSIEALIFCRVVQGLVAGPMIPLSQALLLSSYPPAKSGVALAIWSMTTLVAPVTGPLLGGWITDHISWSWIFYINVPVGLGAAAATWMLYRNRESPTVKRPIDYVGLALLVLWVSSMQLMLDKGRELDWFASGEIITLAIVAAIGFMVFIAWELTDEHPVVDLHLFSKLNFSVATFALSICYGIFFGNVVLLPLWLQQHMGYTATSAGMIMAPVGLLAIFLMPLVGRLVTRTDCRRLSSIAFVVFFIVFWMRSKFNTQVDFETMMIPTLLQGIAMAFFFIPLMNIALGGLSPAMIPAASGLSNFARITAGAFGTSISTTLWDNRAALHHAQLVEPFTQGNVILNQTVNSLNAQGISNETSMALINRMVDVQSYTLAATEIFRISGWIILAMVPIVWLARPPKRTAVADSGGAH